MTTPPSPEHLGDTGRPEHSTPEHPTPGRRTPEFRTVEPRTRGQLRVLRIAEVELEIDGYKARVAGRPVHMPHREFQVLHMLMDNAGRVVTRRELLDQLWGPEHPDIHKTIEVHINRLRRRLRGRGGAERIRTVRGVGYIYDLPDNTTTDDVDNDVDERWDE